MKSSECTNKISLMKNFHEISGLMLGLMLLMLSACAHYAINPRLESIDSALQEKQLGLIGSQQSSEELLLILAFSGGGTRAAALSFGVLEALDRVKMPYAGKEAKIVTTGSEKHTLLDEVDIISSVSGGSFTAAYYGLYGDRIFQYYR